MSLLCECFALAQLRNSNTGSVNNVWDKDPGDEFPIPALLRAARGTYALFIRQGLRDAGYVDIPANGVYLLGGLHAGYAPAGLVVRDVRTTESAKSALVQKLLDGGYVDVGSGEPVNDIPDLVLTDKGHDASHVIYEASRSVAAKLAEKLDDTERSALRHGLAALIEIKEEREEELRAARANETTPTS